MKASAYLSIFDDWDILRVAIATIYDRVDEIVVVDGAYDWMAPFFRGAGRDPAHSAREVEEALAPFAPKLRYIRRLWRNEMEKRQAGYEACSHRYIYRVDADEVLFFDEAALERFFASGRGVASMDMPIYLAPGWIRSKGRGHTPERQTLLFDSTRIDARRHLDYLWLVMPKAEEGARRPTDPAQIFPEPVAFNAHLTQWRTPGTSLTRARFYVLNHIRERGSIGWAPQFTYDSPDAFERLFDQVSPRRLTDVLWGTPIVAGPIGMGGMGVQPTPLSAAQEAVFAHLYTDYRYALARLNRDLAARPRALPAGERYSIDISTPASRRMLGDGRTAFFDFDVAIAECEALVVWICSAPPYVAELKLKPAIDGRRVIVPLPEASPQGVLLGTLQISVWTMEPRYLVTVQADRQAMMAL